MTGVLATVRCNYCSRFLPTFRVHAFGTPAAPAQRICDDCLEWHMKAIELLAGIRIPPGCQGCGQSSEILREISPSQDWRLYVVPRDGIYQVLCQRCILPYTRQRRDLYKDTAFGSSRLM